jgi:diguanylate cyclase (GGDEF)-like protein
MNTAQTNNSQATILVVDDSRNNLFLLASVLTKHGYQVRKADSGLSAIAEIKSQPPDLILLDIQMPDLDGYQVCEQLKAMESICEIPVIFLSGLDEVLDKVKAFKVGGVDYITKPFQLAEVLVRVENQLNLQAAKAEVHKLNEELERRVKLRTQELEREIAEHKRSQEQILHMALHDELTDLPNRNKFLDRLEQAIERSKQRSDYHFSVLFLDCDRFKYINDSLGHVVGDRLLIAVAKRLHSSLHSLDTLARFGGDEFVILLEEIKDISDSIATAERIHQQMKLPFSVGEQEIFVNVSIGIVLGDLNAKEPNHLIRDAETAMYRAKAIGKGNYQLFDANMHEGARKILELETALQKAIEKQEFSINYQPIICLNTKQITGFEALIRWIHPQHGFISPASFIPIAEETGSIVPIGLWVLKESCRQLKTWLDSNQLSNRVSPDLNISVNLSVRQFAQPDLIEQIERILGETQLEASRLKLEITESAIMGNTELASSVLQRLRERQIQLSIDDFGTGYSSLSYLHRFPLDNLKIDRSFVNRIGDTGENLEIVQAIVTLAHNLKMNVTAEGIETVQQSEHLKKLGCEYGQGYYFAKPLDSKSAAALLNNQEINW